MITGIAVMGFGGGAILLSSIVNGLMSISSLQIQPVILVKPNGHCEPYDGSCWVNSELYGDYKDYVAIDLVDLIDSSFCTISDPEYRCIPGHSMGAHGSMRIALAHTDKYRAVASHAGFLDIHVSMTFWLPEVIEECPERQAFYPVKF